MKTGGGNQRGVTLLELMFAIAVLAIVVGLGAPAFGNLMRDNRVAALTNDLSTSFALARSEASKRGLPVTACPSTDGATCTGGDAWGGGWILFTDDTGAPGVVDPPLDAVFQVYGEAAAGFAATAQSPAAEFIRFLPNGAAMPAGEKEIDVRKTGCAGDAARRLSVGTAGRVTIARAAC